MINALRTFKNGGFVIVTDDPLREGEGDLIIGAQFMTEQKMIFMLRHTTGIVCTPLEQSRADALGLHPMTVYNNDRHGTNFTVSCDVKGCTTGVSAKDRTATCIALATLDHTAFTIPGHIFPLVSKNGRRGHTEAGVALCKITGITPVACISELYNHNTGNMLNIKDCGEFGRAYDIPVITVDQIVEFNK